MNVDHTDFWDRVAAEAASAVVPCPDTLASQWAEAGSWE